MIIGTPVHIVTHRMEEYPHMKEGDFRRDKRRCIHHVREDNRCTKIFMQCVGSSHCSFYKEEEKVVITPSKPRKSADKNATSKKKHIASCPKMRFTVIPDEYYKAIRDTQKTRFKKMKAAAKNIRTGIEINKKIGFLHDSRSGTDYVSNAAYKGFSKNMAMNTLNFVFQHKTSDDVEKLFRPFLSDILPISSNVQMKQSKAFTGEKDKIPPCQEVRFYIIPDECYKVLQDSQKYMYQRSLKPKNVSTGATIETKIDFLFDAAFGGNYTSEQLYRIFSGNVELNNINFKFRRRTKDEVVKMFSILQKPDYDRSLPSHKDITVEFQ